MTVNRSGVAFSAVAFAIEPDYLYIGITPDVLVILLHGLLPASDTESINGFAMELENNLNLGTAMAHSDRRLPPTTCATGH